MAVQFASVQTTNNFESATSTLTITKPTSLTVGDLMVFHCTYDNAQTLTPKTGWLDLAVSEDAATVINFGSRRSALQWRIATSGDVAASDFAWTFSGSVINAGSILRIIGNDTSSPLGAGSSDNADNTATPSFTNGITPVAANSLLLMLIASDTATAASAYAITTSNPTWTERYDVAATFSFILAGATATRPETTDTGNSSFTPAGGAAGTDSASFLMAITPAADPSLTPAAISLTAAVAAPTLSVPYSASPDEIEATAAVQAPTITTSDNPWSNTDKTDTSPTITNTPKS